FILLLLLFFAGFLCWFFSWNPASFLSQQLLNFTPESRYEVPLTAADIDPPPLLQQKGSSDQAASLYTS
ncbi:MAG: hypothetical protein CSA20_09580, partial [Deltaproteobacteria bacterium]